MRARRDDGPLLFLVWKGLTAAGQVPVFFAENPFTWIGRRPQSALCGIHLSRVPAKTAENPLTWTCLPGTSSERTINQRTGGRALIAEPQGERGIVSAFFAKNVERVLRILDNFTTFAT